MCLQYAYVCSKRAVHGIPGVARGTTCTVHTYTHTHIIYVYTMYMCIFKKSSTWDTRGRSRLHAFHTHTHTHIHTHTHTHTHTRTHNTCVYNIHMYVQKEQYMGYPGSLAAPYVPWLLTDQVISPPEFQDQYSEKLLYHSRYVRA